MMFDCLMKQDYMQMLHIEEECYGDLILSDEMICVIIYFFAVLGAAEP